MSLASRVRQALPLRLQPAVRYHYERWRGLLERELPVFCGQIGRHDVVIDVGANVGVYVHALNRRGARVEAFEPQPACSAVLQAYAASNPHVRVHPVALGSASSMATLSIPIDRGRLVRGSATLRTIATAGCERMAVPVRTLDSFEFDRVDAIKIDVEGGELDVLRGATATLERARPLLLVEIEQRHHTGPIAAVFAWLENLGYDGTALLPGRGLVPTSEFDPGEHQRLGEDGRPVGVGAEVGVYVNNFLFRARR
jgi:FkbM family methyltransferase